MCNREGVWRPPGARFPRLLAHSGSSPDRQIQQPASKNNPALRRCGAGILFEEVYRPRGTIQTRTDSEAGRVGGSTQVFRCSCSLACRNQGGQANWTLHGARSVGCHDWNRSEEEKPEFVTKSPRQLHPTSDGRRERLANSESVLSAEVSDAHRQITVAPSDWHISGCLVHAGGDVSPQRRRRQVVADGYHLETGGDKYSLFSSSYVQRRVFAFHGPRRPAARGEWFGFELIHGSYQVGTSTQGRRVVRKVDQTGGSCA